MMKPISIWKQELVDGVHTARLASLYCCAPEPVSYTHLPAQDTGIPSSGYMVGQADPSRESGRPRLIKAV